MTTIERAEAALAEVERIVRDVGSSERLHGVADPIAHGVAEPIARFAGARRAAWQLRRAAAEAEGRRRAPRGLVLAVRSIGLAWAAVMLSTLVIAIATRASARRTSLATRPDDDEIRLRTVLGPMAFTSRATALRGGSLECWYGGGFVDLREATLDPAGAVLRVRAIFGGGQLIVPAAWRVTARVRGVGGLKDLRPATELATDAPHLMIEGIAVFGGFTVQPDLPADQAASLEEAVAKAWPGDAEIAAPGALADASPAG
jgi:hypothetical protein